MAANSMITVEYTQEESLTVATNMITGNTHTGEKPYGYHQRDYMLIHTGEKPYGCQQHDYS